MRGQAVEAGWEVQRITDSGRPKFHAELTNTFLAIGPGFAANFNPITDELVSLWLPR